MTAAAYLLLYSLLVIAAGPAMLRHLTRDGHIPQLGVAAWLTAIASVLVSWAAAAVAVIADTVGHWPHRDFVVVSCIARLFGVETGEAGVPSRIVLVALLVFVTGVGGVVAVRVASTLRRMRSHSHRHAEAVQLVGRRNVEHGVLILDSTKPAAYCVSGRPPAIVVTTAAMAALDERQLGAVIAHERAHLAGHHPHIVAVLRALGRVFPRLRLMTEGAEHVSRLLEMCADDKAARRHGRTALLSGLLALCGVAPAGALGAANIAVLARAERLTTPCGDGVRARCRAALTSTLTTLAATPLIIAALAASGVLMCGMH